MGMTDKAKKVAKSLSELKDIIGVTDVQVKTPASKAAQPAEEFVCTDEKAEPTYFEKAMGSRTLDFVVADGIDTTVEYAVAITFHGKVTSVSIETSADSMIATAEQDGENVVTKISTNPDNNHNRNVVLSIFMTADTDIVSMVINERAKQVVKAAKPKAVPKPKSATKTVQETPTTEKETIMSNETNNAHDFILQTALETSKKVIAVVEGHRYSITSVTRAEAAVEGRFFERTVAKTGIAADATKVKIAERYAKTKKAIIARVTRPSRIASILKSKAEPVPTPMKSVDEALNVMKDAMNDLLKQAV